MGYIEYIGSAFLDNIILNEDCNIVIYGCGKYGVKVFDYLSLNGREKNVVCFCDKRAHISVEEMCNREVLTLHETLKKYEGSIFVVAGTYMAEILKILLEKKIARIHLLFL